MSTQEPPHDGVAADADPAVSVPAMPTPPTRVSVAATASTLLLMDIYGSFLSWNSRPCPAHGRVTLASAAREAGKVPTRLGTLPAHDGLIRTGTADPIGLAVWRGKDPGTPEASVD